MVDLFGAIILGIVQGITEWLPVSSSGHLVLLQQAFGLEASVSFDLMLHFSTLLVAVIVFRRDIVSILRDWKHANFTKGYGRIGVLIIIATAFSGAVALLFKDYVDFLFSSTLSVGCGLMVTGALVFSTRLARGGKALGWRKAAFIGLAQGIAVVPGISRSGSTVSASLASGLGREEAVRFSFLLSIPAIAGATAYALTDAAAFSADPVPLAAGMLASFAVGYIALTWLIRLIIRRRFWLFSLYCWTLGSLVLVFSLIWL